MTAHDVSNLNHAGCNPKICARS